MRLSNRYKIYHRYGSCYDARRHGTTPAWHPLNEYFYLSYKEACDYILSQISMGDGSPCETMRKAYKAKIAYKPYGFARTKFDYDVHIFAIVCKSNEKKFLEDENKEA